LVKCTRCKDYYHIDCALIDEDELSEDEELTEIKAKECPVCSELLNPQASDNKTSSATSVVNSGKHKAAKGRKSVSVKVTAKTSPVVPKAESPVAPKGRRSIKTVADADKEKITSQEEQLRKKVVQNLANCLKQGWNALNKDDHLKALLDLKLKKDTTGQMVIDALKMAESIEQALFKANLESCSEAYKEKSRSLFTNLKNPENAFKVFGGDVKPEKLAVMASEELADNELKEMKKQIQEQSIQNSIIEDISIHAVSKKTKKGEEKIENDVADNALYFEPSNSTVVPMVDLTESGSNTADANPSAATSLNVSENSSRRESVISTPANNGSSLDDLLKKVGSTTSVAKPSTTATQPLSVTTSTSLDMKDRMAKHKSPIDELLDDIKNNAAVAVAKPMSAKRASFDFSSSLSSSSRFPEKKARTSLSSNDVTAKKEPLFSSTTVIPQVSPIIEPEIPPVWAGFIQHIDPGAGVNNLFSVKINECAKHPNVDYSWSDLFPHGKSWNIGGRVEPHRIYTYIDEIISTDCNDVLLFQMHCGSKEEDKKGFSDLFRYLYEKARYGVIDNRTAMIKDLYLIALKNNSPLPPFFEAFEHDIPAARYDDIILAVAVVIRKESVDMIDSSPAKAKVLIPANLPTRVSATVVGPPMRDMYGNVPPPRDAPFVAHMAPRPQAYMMPRPVVMSQPPRFAPYPMQFAGPPGSYAVPPGRPMVHPSRAGFLQNREVGRPQYMEHLPPQRQDPRHDNQNSSERGSFRPKKYNWRGV
jgi:hypothetical protein